MKYIPYQDKIAHHGGHQRLFRFPNGYGASLVEGGSMASGGREMAVLKFSGDGEDFSLCYDTEFTDDVLVLGYLSASEIEPLLDRIAALPPHDKVEA